MFKKKWFWMLNVVILLALAGGAYYYYTTKKATASASAAQKAEMQTAVARRGELVVTASGSGQVATSTQFGLGPDQSGTVIELNIRLGDQVKAGDILGRVQTENSPEEIAASISDAELSVIEKQQALEELIATAKTTRTAAMNDIATYSQAVRDAQYQLANYSMPLFMQDMDTIAAVDQTKAELDAAWAAFEPYKFYSINNSKRQDLLEELNLAQSNYDAAVKYLNYQYALQVAQDNLDKARQKYEEYKDGPAADELTLAQAELENAQAKLALAKDTESVIDLIAPIDGTVMTLDANVGEVVENSIMTLADLTNLQIEAYLDETDLDKAVVGNEAEVVFDALPDRVFKGKIALVSPGLETVSNVQAVKVIVLLDASDMGTNLPIGLTASVDIIAGRAENAVLVPVEALRELDTGEYGVFVVENGQPVLHVVQVGLQDITSAEILSGVQAGETVSTGITKTK